jgi:hypothetical protein
MSRRAVFRIPLPPIYRLQLLQQGAGSERLAGMAALRRSHVRGTSASQESPKLPVWRPFRALLPHRSRQRAANPR